MRFRGVLGVRAEGLAEVGGCDWPMLISDIFLGVFMPFRLFLVVFGVALCFFLTAGAPRPWEVSPPS